MGLRRLFEAARSGTPFPRYGDGSQVRDLTFVGDVVDATVAAATEPAPPGTVLNVAGGQPGQPGRAHRPGGGPDRDEHRHRRAPGAGRRRGPHRRRHHPHPRGPRAGRRPRAWTRAWPRWRPGPRPDVRVLVTGGAGFIGANLCRSLLADGHDVRVLDDLSTGRLANLDGLAVDLVEGSVVDADLVARATADVDRIVHLAARASVPRSIAEPRRRPRGQRDRHGGRAGGRPGPGRARGPGLVVVGLRRHRGLARSTRACPVAPRSPYAASKLAAEGYALAYQVAYGLPVLALRFFNVYGPLQPADHAYAAVVPRFVDAALARPPPRGPRRRPPEPGLHLRGHGGRRAASGRSRADRRPRPGEPGLRHPHRPAGPDRAARGDPRPPRGGRAHRGPGRATSATPPPTAPAWRPCSPSVEPGRPRRRPPGDRRLDAPCVPERVAARAGVELAAQRPSRRARSDWSDAVGVDPLADGAPLVEPGVHRREAGRGRGGCPWPGRSGRRRRPPRRSRRSSRGPRSASPAGMSRARVQPGIGNRAGRGRRGRSA